MGLPTPAKTWQFAHTTVPALGTGLQDLQRGMRVGIVNALLGMTGAPSVSGSSDGTTAALDATNRWTGDVALVWATSGTPHSWIVLRFSTLYYLLIDLNSGSSASISAYLSFAGFTGGSTTNRPTATDEAQIIGTGGSPGGWVNSGADAQRVWHVMMPTDSSGVRVLMYTGNVQESFWLFGKAVNTVSGWTHPIYGVIHFSSLLDGFGTYSNLFNAANVTAVGPTTPMSMFVTSEATSSGALGSVQTTVNDLDGGYVIATPGLYSTTVGSVGRHGQIEDLWWGSTTPATGDTYPSGGSATFLQAGDMVFPWDGTALTIA